VIEEGVDQCKARESDTATYVNENCVTSPAGYLFLSMLECGNQGATSKTYADWFTMNSASHWCILIVG
jgi:hypothetical protein